MDIVNIFPEKLRMARKQKDLTQQQLAEAIGLTPQTISAYENGNKTPSLDIAAALAEKLDISLDHLCGLSRRAECKFETFADVVTLIELLMKSASTEITPKEYALPPEECHRIEFAPDEYEEITTESGIEVAIRSYCLNYYYSNCEKIFELYRSNVIDESTHKALKEGLFAKMKEKKIGEWR